jgi:hypothetical protein
MKYDTYILVPDTRNVQTTTLVFVSETWMGIFLRKKFRKGLDKRKEGTII